MTVTGYSGPMPTMRVSLTPIGHMQSNLREVKSLEYGGVHAGFLNPKAYNVAKF